MTHLCSCSGKLASMLEISRKEKQLSKSLCRSCGGDFFVNGIESEPASMLSTVDLVNFVTSGLTWQKVKKGSRSANRRSRKTITPCFSVGAKLGGLSRKRDQDSSVSESEKLGVAVLGRRFAEKVVDVPIKKRRLLNQATSPTQISSLDHEEVLSYQNKISHHEGSDEQLLDSKLVAAAVGKQCAREPHSSSKKKAIIKSDAPKLRLRVNDVRSGKKSGERNGVRDYDDDFSGIQLLASAACNSSIYDDGVFVEKFVVEGSVEADGIYLPSADMPFKESIASSKAGNFTEKDLINEDDMGYSFVESGTVSVNLNRVENDEVVENRAHWDLNTVMETWEEPSDDAPLDNLKVGDPKCGVSDVLQCEKFVVESNEMQRELEDTQCGVERAVETMVCHKVLSNTESSKILVNSDSMDVATVRSCSQENNLQACSFPKGTSIEKEYVTETKRVSKPLNFEVVHIVTSNRATSMEATPDYFCPGLHQTASSHVFDEKVDASGSDLEQTGEASSETSFAENKYSFAGSSQAVKLEILSPHVPLLNKSNSEIDGGQIKDCKDYEETLGLTGCSTSPMLSSLTCKTFDVGNFHPVRHSVGELVKADHFHPSPKGEALSASSTSAAVGEVKRQGDTVSATDNTGDDFANQIVIMELLGKSTTCLDKIGPENNFSDCYGSYATHDRCTVEVGSMIEYDTGYDSSFEDGELRESGEENDIRGETECLDFGSDYGDRKEVDSVDCTISENVETERGSYGISNKELSVTKIEDMEKMGITGNTSAVDGKPVRFLKKCVKGNHLKEQKLRVDQFNDDLFCGSLEGNVDICSDKVLLAGEFGSRTSGGNFLFYGKGGFVALERKNKHTAHRSSYENTPYSHLRTEREPGVEKFAGRDKFSLKARSRNEVDGYWVNSAAGYRETRSCYSHSYRHNDVNGYSLSRDAFANSGANVDELQSHGDRRSINYSSNGIYRPITRRPPADRDDVYSVQRGASPLRGICGNGNRGRSAYAQGIRRGPKQEYPKDVSDDADVPSVRRQHFFDRRESGFSPNYRPRKIYRSRSQTRSAAAWRDRNVGTRRHSPGLRPDTRMERMSPFQKPSSVDDELFISPQSGRLSPLSDSRWFDNGKYADNYFRDARSPMRMIRRGQRFDAVGYSERLKSDNSFQSMPQRGQFHQASGSGRRRDFEGSGEEKRKFDRYEMSRQVRRYDAGGAARKFRYDTKDCFEGRNSQNDECFTGASKRDLLPRNGE